MNHILQIPSCNDFVSLYGFDCSIDEDFVQKCVFRNGEYKLTLNFYIPIDALKISISKSDKEYFYFYREDLSKIMLDENGDFMNLTFSSGIELLINLYPIVRVSIK